MEKGTLIPHALTKESDFSGLYKIYKFQPVQLLSALILLLMAQAANANYYCTGKIRYLGTDTGLFVSNGFGVHRLCDIAEERCKAWLSMAMTAQVSDRVITIYYRSDSPEGGEQANGFCKEIGNWVTPAEPPYHMAFQ